MKHDIHTEQDIQSLVNTFYDKVNSDRTLSPIFNEVARVNWPIHLPTMYSFWSTLLLGAKTYHGQPWPKHAPLPVHREHFERWLALFFTTIDELFEGPTAEQAKFRAQTIATIFQSKLGLLSIQIMP